MRGKSHIILTKNSIAIPVHLKIFRLQAPVLGNIKGLCFIVCLVICVSMWFQFRIGQTNIEKMHCKQCLDFSDRNLVFSGLFISNLQWNWFRNTHRMENLHTH